MEKACAEEINHSGITETLHTKEYTYESVH